jgi:thiol-disulfide isomerase/thioredoxin
MASSAPYFAALAIIVNAWPSGLRIFMRAFTCMPTALLPETPHRESVVAPPAALWVICLCADWCGLCRDYAVAFAETALRYPGHRFVWLDIEDEAELVGDLEVETFPTLLIADADGTRFLGPLTPHAQTLTRLLDSLEQTGTEPVPHLPSTQALLRALEAAPPHRVGAQRQVR